MRRKILKKIKFYGELNKALHETFPFITVQETKSVHQLSQFASLFNYAFPTIETTASHE